jgi:hypothetical protein
MVDLPWASNSCVTERVEASLGATSDDGRSATFCCDRRRWGATVGFFGAPGVEAEAAGAFLAPARLVAPTVGLALRAEETLSEASAGAAL